MSMNVLTVVSQHNIITLCNPILIKQYITYKRLVVRPALADGNIFLYLYLKIESSHTNNIHLKTSTGSFFFWTLCDLNASAVILFHLTVLFSKLLGELLQATTKFRCNLPRLRSNIVIFTPYRILYFNLTTRYFVSGVLLFGEILFQHSFNFVLVMQIYRFGHRNTNNSVSQSQSNKTTHSILHNNRTCEQ